MLTSSSPASSLQITQSSSWLIVIVVFLQATEQLFGKEQGKHSGSAGILACVVSGNDRLTEASRQGCLRSQEARPTLIYSKTIIRYFEALSTHPARHNQNTGSANFANTAAEAFSTSACSELPCASMVTMAGKSVTRSRHIASGMPNSSSFTSSTSSMHLA